MMTITEITKEANKFLREAFNTELTVPIEINNRLSRTQGQFTHRYDNTPVSVELAGYLVKNNKPSIILEVLKHELVHYALCKRGEPFDDGDPHFENMLERLDVVSQSTFSQRLSDLKLKPRKQVIYACTGCGEEWTVARRLNNDGRYHHCSSCGVDKGRLKRISN